MLLINIKNSFVNVAAKVFELLHPIVRQAARQPQVQSESIQAHCRDIRLDQAMDWLAKTKFKGDARHA